MRLVIGTYSSREEPGIYLYNIDPAQADLGFAKSISGITNPSYLVLSSDKSRLYAISESKSGAAGQLNIYSTENNDLTFVDAVDFQGGGSCFIGIDGNRRHAFIANYGDGSLTVIELPEVHQAARVAQRIEFQGHGPDPDRQEQPHIHSVLFSADQQFLYCADLGTDRLYKFRYHPAHETPLSPCTPFYTNLPPGSGPRHMAIDTANGYIFLFTELSGKIFRYRDEEPFGGWLEETSIVDEDYKGKIEAADIQINPDNHCLYVSNRGDANDISVYDIHPETGSLTLKQRVGAEGCSPRSLAIWADEGLLFVANEKGNSVTVFHINEAGKLTFSGNTVALNRPACVKLIND